jgi:hypothetical protein
MTVALKGRNRCRERNHHIPYFAPSGQPLIFYSPTQGVALGCPISALQAVPLLLLSAFFP